VNRFAVILAALGLVILSTALVMYRGRRQPAAAPVAARADRGPAPATPPPLPPVNAAAAVPTRGADPARRARAKSTASTPAPAAPTPAAPATATLTIVSDVPGAQVFLDRRFIGTTPATAADVAPGAHQLNVSAPGFDAFVESIEGAAGPRELSIAFREVRLDASIDVVHKHRMGSWTADCQSAGGAVRDQRQE